MNDINPVMKFLVANRGALFPLSAAALIFVILVPLPTPLLDLLLVANIVLSTVTLMTVMYIGGPLEFSSFPPLLLAMTLLRLVSNVATTRLILANGANGAAAAGHVVEAYAQFVAGNSLVVGVIIFVIITVIQFVVITKGATRIAEVAARFTLDGLPGKQMAIDADLNAGSIDEHEARRRRQDLTREADFYGAMDGASKFVRGDAVAALVITFVNVLGGIYVGMVEGGLDLMQSLEIYTKLSIGDGLASQLPAFILSIGAGMLVTRSAGKTNMGEEILGQLLSKPIALVLAAGFLAVLTLTPLPSFPLLIMATACGGIAYFVNQSQVQGAQRRVIEEKTREKTKPEPVENNLQVDALELQIGIGLVRLVDKARGGDLLDRIAALRKQLAVDLGIVAPRCRIRDSADLAPNDYCILLRGQAVARGELYLDQLLAMDSGMATEPLSGAATREPAFGLDAWWILPGERDRAARLGYAVVEPMGVLTTHVTETLRRHAAELLTRAEVHKLLDNLKQRNAQLVDEVTPALLKPGEVQRVLQNLLRERVPIRDLETILEALGDWSPRTKDTEILTEYARNALARTICGQLKDAASTIHCVTLDPSTEDLVQANILRLEGGATLALAPDQQQQFADIAKKLVERATPAAGGASVVVLCSPQIRSWVRRMLEPILPQTAVLALNEIVRGVDVRAHGVIHLDAKPANLSS